MNYIFCFVIFPYSDISTNFIGRLCLKMRSGILVTETSEAVLPSIIWFNGNASKIVYTQRHAWYKCYTQGHGKLKVNEPNPLYNSEVWKSCFIIYGFPFSFICLCGNSSSHFKRLPIYPYFSLYGKGKKSISIIFTLLADTTWINLNQYINQMFTFYIFDPEAPWW